MLTFDLYISIAFHASVVRPFISGAQLVIASEDSMRINVEYFMEFPWSIPQWNPMESSRKI